MPNSIKNGMRMIAALAGVACVAGCNLDGSWANTRFATAPAKVRALEDESTKDLGIDLLVTERGEVDLVEDVIAARDRYKMGLRELHAYYQSQGYPGKADWVESELKGLKGVQQFHYVLDAEVPSAELRAADRIEEADALYQKGMDLMRRGGHGVPAFYRRDRMVEAARTFRQLISNYPSSDKIDDAAFFCGEIHKEYLSGQAEIAVRWYERAFGWDPNTPHPARFQAAVVCDYRLHDRARALELYQAVLDSQTDNPGNARFATRRIGELTDARPVVRTKSVP